MKFFKNTGNIIILGFITAAIAMILMAYKATTVKYEMVIEGDYYQEEVRLNDLIDAKRNANRFGTAFSLTQKESKIIITIPSELSDELENGRVEFYCVPDKSKDSQQILAKNNDGIYYFNREQVASGRNYLVKISFKSKEKEYFKEFKML